MKRLCGVVIPARDEEKYIENTLVSLVNQTSPPFIVVVNDGSVDATGELASKHADVVVNLPRHEDSWVGRPELAKVINAGFDILRNVSVEYVMVSGSEAVYPPHYIEEITRRMKREGVVMASGVAEGERARSFSPRGSGRVIDSEWFRSIGFKYPENYGFEAYVVFKALSQGKTVAVYPDVRFKLQRRTQFSSRKAYYWGKGMRALNYDPLYVLGRVALLSLRSPRIGFAMLKGYLSSDVEKYHDLSKFVSTFQRRYILFMLRELVKNP
ncbi:MAG: hypothetical protein B7L53_09285 [Thermofilum sp. NZ13]|nr:MAG: hypothetical protein B7L53_09285 [Thermofilum sp. NZ13]